MLSTSDEQSRQGLFEALQDYNLPVGAYIVRKVDDEDIITNCNQEFAAIFHFESAAAAVGTPLSKLYESDEDQQKFESALIHASKDGGKLSHWIESLRTIDGEPITVEIQCRADYDAQGILIGRTGVVFQYSEFELLLQDLGQVLHQFSGTSMFIQHRITPIMEALYPDPFAPVLNVPTAEEADTILTQPAMASANALKQLIADISENPRALSAFRDNQWQDLNNTLRMLQEYKELAGSPEERPALLQHAARTLLGILESVPGGTLKRELQREARTQAWELQRKISLYDLHQIMGRLVEIEHEVNSLREFWLYDLRSNESQMEVQISELLSDVQRSMLDFAQTRGVKIRIDDRTRRLTVRMLHRDVLRALQNLLHNAIKYSWGKVDGSPWVTLRASADSQYLTIEMENYGVPVTHDEVEKGLVFRLGYRGQYSGDRARKGTGVGLYDARRVAVTHGGDVTIDSRPARAEFGVDDYTKPFVTVVKFRLPLFSKDIR